MRFYFLAITSIVFTTGFCFQSCSNTDRQQTGEGESNSSVEMTPLIPYQIINDYPHDPTAFTEGLEYVNGYIYESTGEYGASVVRKTKLETGDVLQEHRLDNNYFGEGLTVLNGKVYQLTYQEKTGFVYDMETLKLLETFKFHTAEGWGMTNDSTHLIYGDGTSYLYFLDPDTYKEVKRIQVIDPYGTVENINELEYINGYIYANQWQTDNILKIDPATGKVVGRADLRTLRQRTGIPPMTNRHGTPEVLNGIAYDAKNNRIFITGKYWPKIFEIKLDN